MSTVDPSLPRTGRVRSLRDDLLDDLRRAAPMPTAPVPADVPLREVAPPAVPLPDVAPSAVPAGDPARSATATFELRFTPRLWSGLRLQSLGAGGFLLGAGPVQVSLTGFRR